MNFNLYLDRTCAVRLERVARRTRRPRNALVREAVRIRLDRDAAAWPKEVLAFGGDPLLVPFEAHRDELAAVADDPFGSSSGLRRGRRKAR